MGGPDGNVGLPARGQVLAGKYRVERVLGVGGMGAVLAAHHLQLDERVALKLLLPELASQADVVARFLREGRAAIKIRGAHVARVLDVGTLEDGIPYIVMEHLEGADLDQVVARDGPQPVVDVVLWVQQACEALAEAHGRGLVHRDLKPANLFLTRAPDGGALVKVLDFGISKVVRGGDLGLTDANVALGSPRYMAPEQARRDRPVDARTDIWALGTILHELLTGAPAFDAETLPELVGKLLLDTAPELRASRPDVPVELEAVVRRCLAKDPDARFATVAELAEALAPFGGPDAAMGAARVARVLATAEASDVRWSVAVPSAPASLGRSTGPGMATTVEATLPAGDAEPAARARWERGRTARRAATRAARIAAGVAFAGALVGAGVFVGRRETREPEASTLRGGAGVARADEGEGTAATREGAGAPPSATPTPVAVAALRDADAATPRSDASARAPGSSAIAPAAAAPARAPVRRRSPDPQPAPSTPGGQELFEDRK